MNNKNADTLLANTIRRSALIWWQYIGLHYAYLDCNDHISTKLFV